MESFPDIIELNVGGKYMSTMLSTLTKYPDTMLAAMFTGRHGYTRDKDGRYFIDCNGKVFEYILDFLRVGTLPNDTVSREVYALAEYFGLRDIMLKHSRQLTQTYKEEDDVIELNVRGTIIATTRQTLTLRNSKLASIFTESPQLPKGTDGRFFIDCKPDVFQNILDLITGKLYPCEIKYEQAKYSRVAYDTLGLEKKIGSVF